MDSRRESYSFRDTTANPNSSITMSTTSSSAFSIPPEIQDKQKYMIEALQKTTAENKALLENISKLFSQKLDLDQSKFSDATKNLLRKLVIAKEEMLPEFDETSLQICVDKKVVDEVKRRREEKFQQRQYRMLFQRYSKFLETQGKLMEALQKLNLELENTIDEPSKNTLLQTKLGEYERKMEELEVELENMDWKNNEPANVLEKSKKCLEMKGKLVDLNKRLQPFQGLPPNLLQAKQLLERKRAELNQINEELNRKMS